jgi:hypothetical protein
MLIPHHPQLQHHLKVIMVLMLPEVVVELTALVVLVLEVQGASV